MNNPGITVWAAHAPPGKDANPAAAAIAAAAVVRNIDAIHERGIEQEIAASSRECLAVDLHLADFWH
jgi:hypothetical protein